MCEGTVGPNMGVAAPREPVGSWGTRLSRNFDHES